MARNVPLEHVAKKLALKNGAPTDPPPLGPNQMQLFSYYAPGLEAGNYSITAEHNISSASFEKGSWTQSSLRIINHDLKNPPKPTEIEEPAAQTFTVMAPQFSIDRSMINSYYPPDGHQDEARILPHIVFNDPHFPWERAAGKVDFCDPDLESDRTTPKLDPTTKKPVMRSKVPWVAVMVFDPSDLTLDPTFKPQMTSSASPPDLQLQKQPATGAFPMKVSDYYNIDPSHRIKYDKAADVPTESMQAIFPTKDTFMSLFSHRELTRSGVAAQGTFVSDVTAQRYLAHVRAINTAGFPDSGLEAVGNYSIVVSGRTANLGLTKPTTQIAHLISIEHVDTTLDSVRDEIAADANKGQERIALVSLFSWIYLALPPNPVNFVDSIENVVKGMQMLRPLDAGLDKLAPPPTNGSPVELNAATVLQARLRAGYVPARWRAETGEESLAFSRGALLPMRVQHPPVQDWCAGSNTSKEFQILDPNTGMMDLSYSSAWQLGKALAIADTTFSGALLRFRSLVYTWATDKARKDTNQMPSAHAVFASVPARVNHMAQLTVGNTNEPRRVIQPTARTLAPHAVDDPALRPHIALAMKDAVTQQANAGDQIWTEFSLDKPNNSDWTAICGWLSQKLSLADIPAHYLIPDPSFLPDESLRFFHIDDNWTDCLLDGALSVANHMDRDDDLARTYIKEAFNAYLRQKVAGIDVVMVPRWGFILHSQIVKVMPDMRITIQWQDNDDHPHCRYTKLDDQTLMCLLDRQPGDLTSITLSQPAHQQRFSLGYDLNTSDPKKPFPEFKLRQLYTQGAPSTWGEIHSGQPTEEEEASWYDAASRMARLSKMAPAVNRKLTEALGSDAKNPLSAYLDYVPTSAELAMELNDPCYYFLIKPPSKNGGSATDLGVRQLWTIDDKPWSADPVPAPDTTESAAIGAAEAANANTAVPFSGTSPSSASASTGVTRIDGPPIWPANPSGRPPGQLRSCFSLQVFADYKGLPVQWPDNRTDVNAYIPSGNDFLFDLVFSVRKTSSVAQMLSEILISIPHTGTAKSEEPLIKEHYQNERARMMGNQRFVPYIVRTASYLQIRLVPRTAKPNPAIIVNDSRTADLSFRLAEVPIAPGDPGTRKPMPLPVHGQDKRMGYNIKVQILERYAVGNTIYNVPGNAGSSAGAAFVAKLDVKDG